VNEGEDDEDGDDSDRESSSQSGRTSLEETVDGFPAPPTQIPTPSSRATSFISDARRPISSVSEDSEEGDGASLYDNYCYSRLSISSKMSKSSGYTVATIPPPIPTELPPPARSHSQDSQYSAPAPPSEPPSSSPSEPSSSVSPPPREMTGRPQATTRTIPPPLTLEKSRIDREPTNSNLVTATTTSPLFYANFGALQSPPPDLKSPTKRSPIGATSDLRGRGAAPALRQKVEQSVVQDGNEGDVPLGIRLTPPQSPSLLPAAGPLTASTRLEKKKRGDGPPPLVVMNPTPSPPPYPPKAPLLLQASSTPSSPTPTAIPTPSTPNILSRAGAVTAAIAESTNTDTAQPLTTTASNSSPFLPHPNAPKPNSSPQAPLYGRAMPCALLPSTLLIQAMRRAAQMRVAPNGLPRFSTVYGSTAQDLTMAAGPVLIYFSLDPPNDIPANRMRAAPATVAVMVPPSVPTSNQNALSPAPALGAQPSLPSHRQGAGATTDVIPRAGFVPKAGAVRPRSRSFSGFDSALAPETQQKGQRYSHLSGLFCFGC